MSTNNLAKNAMEPGPLSWVKGEIDHTLGLASAALEQYAEDPTDPSAREALQSCLGHLHEVTGTLRMVEVQGGILLAEEMEQLLLALVGGHVESSAAEVLVRALLPLPDYLERLQNGARDFPIVLLPIINELRAARHEAALAEDLFFFPDLSVVPAFDLPPVALDGGERQNIARRARSLFQSGLVAWSRNPADTEAVHRLRQAMEQLYTVTTHPDAMRLWWAGAGLVEAVQDNGLEPAVVRPLFGKVERQTKRYLDAGDPGVSANPPWSLTRQILYHVACARSHGPLVSALRSSFCLQDALPTESDLAAARGSLRGTNRALMETVSSALREDLTKVMETLDLFVRRRDQNVAALRPMLEQVHQIAGTLAIIDQEVARTELHSVAEILATLINPAPGTSALTANAITAMLLPLADRFVHVESILAGLGGASSAGEGSPNFAMGDRQLHQAVFQQAIDSLNRAKAATLVFAQTPTARDAHAWETLQTALHEVSGGLGMLGLERPSQLALACLHGLHELPESISGAWLDRLADAIAALELYLEEQIQNRSGESFLVQGESAIAAWASLAGATPALPSASVPPLVLLSLEEEPPLVLEGFEDTSQLLFQSLQEEDPPLVLDGFEAEEPEEQPLSSVPMPQQKSGSDVDPEMVEVFTEEATEEMATLDQHLPLLRVGLFPQEGGQCIVVSHTPQDSLLTVRRSFHTLKGSGRMVGAIRLGELAWAVENLLNRAIDHTVRISPSLLHVVEDARLVLPTLLEDFQTGRNTAQGVEEIAEQAWRLAHAGPRLTTPSVPVPTPTPDEPGIKPSAAVADRARADIESNVFALFEAETKKHLATAEEAIAVCRDNGGGFSNPEGLLRALHTLQGSARVLHTIEGSAKTVGVGGIGYIAQALEQYVRTCLATDIALDEQGLQWVEAGVGFIRVWLSALTDQNTVPSIDDWLSQIEAATHTMVSNHVSQSPPAAEIDEALEMFLEEATDALKNAEQILAEWQSDTSNVAVLQPLQSLLKTVASNADLVGIPAIAALCGTLNDLLERIAVDAQICHDDTVPLCIGAMEQLWIMLDDVHDHQSATPQDELCHAIAELLRTQPISPLINAAVLADPPSQPALVTPAPPSFTQTSTPPPDTERGTERGDLMEMFLGEAEDLMGTMDGLLRQLSVAPNHVALVAELRRTLHTLKGGARMVGIQAIADLSHALESMIDSVVDGHLPATQRLFDLVQTAGDHLSAMIDRVRAGQPVEPATVLHHHIENLVTQQLSLRPAETTIPSASPPPPSDAEGSGARAVSNGVDNEPGDRRTAPRIVSEQVRVAADLLNQLVNYAAEVSITRSRVDQQMAGQRHSLQEMAQTVSRLRDQWRRLEMETEFRILHLHPEVGGADFDPLELERYSNLQQLSRSLMESVSDLASLHGMLSATTLDAEMLLLQQSRITKELQEGLMRTRTVPFAGVAQRLRRIVRQTAQELNLQAELRLVGAEIELDRTVLDRMLAPLEHMLRNSISHGLEPPEVRRAAGKPETGLITIHLRRDGQEIVISAGDDGRGLDIPAIRRKAKERGLLAHDALLADKEVMQFILEPGFSTASQVTQIAGRGVGMDVVRNEVLVLGGTLSIDSEVSRGTTFTVRLPLTLAVSKSLLVNVQGDLFAIPLVAILAVLQLSHDEANRLYEDPRPVLMRGGVEYTFAHAATLLEAPLPTRPLAVGEKLPVLLFGIGEIHTALAVDGLLGAREIVVKSVGPQLGRVREIAGATILGDGRVAIILDMAALLRKSVALYGSVLPTTDRLTQKGLEESAPSVLVVDDSITVRRVTARLLERHHMTVFTARDGVDAVALLQKQMPDLILMDIEMPRMDGYELATYIRSDPRLQHIPIIMITSRTGPKHRKRAAEVGVTHYLGKPYQETELLEAIHRLRLRAPTLSTLRTASLPHALGRLH